MLHTGRDNYYRKSHKAKNGHSNIFSLIIIYNAFSLNIFVAIVQSLSCVQPFAAPCTVVYQVPVSMGVSKQEYWSKLPFPSPGDIPRPEIKPVSSVLAGRLFIIEPLGKPLNIFRLFLNLLIYTVSKLNFHSVKTKRNIIYNQT